jgi:dGTPase
MHQAMEKFLCNKRKASSTKSAHSGRSDFRRDFDRIVFSSAFRRLQSKTQVFPLPETDFIHTRLTHSLEASCVGRSLGAVAALDLDIDDDIFASIVAAACLAHDIGNPPFGHSGEDAISHFFLNDGKAYLDGMDDSEKADFQIFEGNAMGFRLLTKSLPSQSEIEGGLNLTYATLGAFTKYPRESSPVKIDNPCYKKFGFFQSEKSAFEEIVNEMGLKEKDLGNGIKAWQRYPLAYLVEAADDICYSIMDLEDGFKLGLLSFEQLKEHLSSLTNLDDEKLKKLLDDREKASYMRAKAVNSLVTESAKAFCDNIDSILDGSFDNDLLSVIPKSECVEEIKKFSFEHVYSYHKAVEIEAAGFEVLGGLLNLFLSAIYNPSDAKSKKIKSLIPKQFHSDETVPNYERVMLVVQFVSGMTDTYAIDMYRKLKGISLPNY